MLFFDPTTYIFVVILVHGPVDSSVGTPAYFLEDFVLVDELLR